MNIFIVDIQIITFHKVTQNENELRYRTITLPTFLPALLSGPLDNRLLQVTINSDGRVTGRWILMTTRGDDSVYGLINNQF